MQNLHVTYIHIFVREKKESLLLLSFFLNLEFYLVNSSIFIVRLSTRSQKITGGFVEHHIMMIHSQYKCYK